MVKMKFFIDRKYLLFLFVCFACANVKAQMEQTTLDSLYEEEIYEEETFENNIYLTLLSFSVTNQLPIETFAKNLTRTSFGLGFSYFNNFSKKDDLFWSLHVSGFRIARLSNSYTVFDQFGQYDLFTKTKTSLLFLGYGVRYYPDIYTPKLEPFIDVKMGANYIYTFTSDTLAGSEEAEVMFNNNDFSFAYMVGLGVQYNVRIGQAFHFVLNYNGGTNATYYIDGEKGQQIPFDNFVRRTTELDYVQAAFGLTLGF